MSQTSVAPHVLTSWRRMSWPLFLLLVVLLLVLSDVLVLRFSCPGASQSWKRSKSAELKPAVEAISAGAGEIGPLAAAHLKGPGGNLEAADRGEMEEADRGGLEEADPRREMGEADPRRGMGEAELRGMDERSADRLQYPGRKRVKGFVGVHTGFKNRRRRALLRETWFPATPEEHARVEAATGLVFRFIVGHGTSEEGEQVLQAENSTHGDFLRIDVQESYLNLNRKTLVYFTSLFKLYEAEFYVKADDDIYLIPDRLSSLIARPRKSPRTYIGCMKKGAVGSNPNIKWYERKSWLLGSHYFVHAFGAIYLLSYDVVNILNAIPEDGLSMFTNEDVSVGAWMLAFDVQHEKTAYLCRKDCTPSAVAIWEPLCAGLCKPDVQMKELHRNPACSGTGTF
ncbi:unnamed protein product [Closterium sp. NIES-53]